jgi:hypothetical protein
MLKSHAMGSDILYLVFNRVAQEDAEKRMAGESISCVTIHGCALRAVREHLPLLRFDVMCDERESSEKISQLMATVLDRLPWQAGSKPGAVRRDRKVLCSWVRKTLDRWLHSSQGRDGLSDEQLCFYPAKREFQSQRGKGQISCLASKPRPSFYVEQARRLWEGMERGEWGRLPHDAVMKLAQLHALPLRARAVLLDECQDATNCQLAWVLALQRHAARYCVGDMAQRVYSFRGVNRRALHLIEPHVTHRYGLTGSFRFGERIARVANTILHIKHSSSPAGECARYTVTGLAPYPGVVCAAAADGAAPAGGAGQVAVIARSNQALFSHAVALLCARAPAPPRSPGGSDDDSCDGGGGAAELAARMPRIHLLGGAGGGGGAGQFRRDLAGIEAAHALFEGRRPAGGRFAGFESWGDLVAEAEALADGGLRMVVGLVEEYGARLPRLVALFEEHVLKAGVPAAEADVILSTVHKAPPQPPLHPPPTPA